MWEYGGNALSYTIVVTMTTHKMEGSGYKSLVVCRCCAFLLCGGHAMKPVMSLTKLKRSLSFRRRCGSEPGRGGREGRDGERRELVRGGEG